MPPDEALPDGPGALSGVYTIFDIHPLLADEFAPRGAMSCGLAWHFARPPVQGLEDNVMALFGAIRAWNCSVANVARTGRISAKCGTESQ